MLGYYYSTTVEGLLDEEGLLGTSKLKKISSILSWLLFTNNLFILGEILLGDDYYSWNFKLESILLLLLLFIFVFVLLISTPN